MRVAICGVSGFVGTYLSRALVKSGYEVVGIDREYFCNSLDYKSTYCVGK